MVEEQRRLSAMQDKVDCKGRARSHNAWRLSRPTRMVVGQCDVEPNSPSAENLNPTLRHGMQDLSAGGTDTGRKAS